MGSTAGKGRFTLPMRLRVGAWAATSVMAVASIVFFVGLARS